MLFGNKNLPNNDELVTLSFKLLKSDKKLLVFAFLSILINAFVIIILFHYENRLMSFKMLKAESFFKFMPYFIIYGITATFINTFFNTAIIACLKKNLNNEKSRLADGFTIAFKRFDKILEWTLFTVTLGALLRIFRSIQTKWLFDTASDVVWELISYFIVPIFVYENVGIFKAIKRASDIFGRKWSDEVEGSITFGIYAIFFLGGCLIILMFADSLGNQNIFFISLLGIGFSMIMLIIILSSVNSIFNTVLYLYAKNDEKILTLLEY